MKRKNKITRPDVIELKGMPTAVKVGYRDIKIDYIRPDFKSDEMTDCYGEYRAREGKQNANKNQSNPNNHQIPIPVP